MSDVAGLHARLRADLLQWYDQHARALPWRVGPLARGRGERPDAYRVWLSEIMLQQTTTVHAAPYFERFTHRWPDVLTLAQADDAEVMAAWAGLGYYARARNLLACARAVVRDHGGVFPDTEAGLRALPGVGSYTAAAIAAIAFDRPANVVDGNVERVMARLHAHRSPLPAAKPELAALAARFVTSDRPGDWAQALMDLGSMVCRPRSPACEACPLAWGCAARSEGQADRFPLKAPKKARPHRCGLVWVLLDDAGRVAVVRRPARGLLGGMLGLPTSEWGQGQDESALKALAPAVADWQDAGSVEHVFTHFSLSLSVHVARGAGDLDWKPVDEARAALPSVFRKALERALASR